MRGTIVRIAAIILLRQWPRPLVWLGSCRDGNWTGAGSRLSDGEGGINNWLRDVDVEVEDRSAAKGFGHIGIPRLTRNNLHLLRVHSHNWLLLNSDRDGCGRRGDSDWCGSLREGPSVNAGRRDVTTAGAECLDGSGRCNSREQSLVPFGAGLVLLTPSVRTISAFDDIQKLRSAALALLAQSTALPTRNRQRATLSEGRHCSPGDCLVNGDGFDFIFLAVAKAEPATFVE